MSNQLFSDCSVRFEIHSHTAWHPCPQGLVIVLWSLSEALKMIDHREVVASPAEVKALAKRLEIGKGKRIPVSVEDFWHVASLPLPC